VTETQWDYSANTNVSGCDSLSIEVTPITADDQKGPATLIGVITDYGVPGEPKNFQVTFQSDTEILLEWDPPVENPACIDE